MSDDLQTRLERRLSIGALPTPIQYAQSLSAQLGVDVDLKRDDLIGDLLTGTKVRSLAYILWQALEDGVTDLITVGQTTSNQCRLVAILGARLGLKIHLLLRDPEDGYTDHENLAIMQACNAQLSQLSESEWRLHGLAVKRLSRRIAKAGGKALFIPFGCGGMPGTLGIVDLIREIQEQHDGQFPYSHLVLPAGSGSALFGLDLGFRLLNIEVKGKTPRLLGASVAQERDTILKRVDQLYAQTDVVLGHGLARSEALQIEDRWRDLAPAQAHDAFKRFATTHQFLPDPLYVLRAMMALEAAFSEEVPTPPTRILFLVTGACRTLRSVASQSPD